MLTSAALETVAPPAILSLILVWLMRLTASGAWVSRREADTLRADRDWLRGMWEQARVDDAHRAETLDGLIDQLGAVRDLLAAVQDSRGDPQ